MELKELRVGEKYLNEVDDVYKIMYVGIDSIVAQATQEKVMDIGEELIYPIDTVLAYHKKYIPIKEI